MAAFTVTSLSFLASFNLPLSPQLPSRQQSRASEHIRLRLLYRLTTTEERNAYILYYYQVKVHNFQNPKLLKFKCQKLQYAIKHNIYNLSLNGQFFLDKQIII